MTELAAELKARSSGDAAARRPPIFVFIHGLQKFKKLRQEDDFSFSGERRRRGQSRRAVQRPHQRRQRASASISSSRVDTFNNVNRFMSRKALSEFEMRVVFQMSANDSASLIDSPKAASLGLHRALLYNEQDGTLETFRPYAPPDAAWFRDAAAKLAGTGLNR